MENGEKCERREGIRGRDAKREKALFRDLRITNWHAVRLSSGRNHFPLSTNVPQEIDAI